MAIPLIVWGLVALGGALGIGSSGCSETPAPRGPVAKPEEDDDGKSWWDRADDDVPPPPRKTEDPPKTEVPPETKPPVDPNDLDGDGYKMCKSPDELLKQVEEGVVTCDCNDDNKNINPNAADNVGDFAEYTDKDGNVVKVPDQNCDLVDGVDVDKDGHASVASGGKDCDDNKANVKPGGINRLNSKVDWDCDGEKGDYDLAKDTVRINGEITAMAMGDVDGDGLDDVVVSNVDGGGEFGIYFGKNLVAGGIKVFPDDADVLVQGNILDLGLGSALAMVDNDGDGKMEIVAGTSGYNAKYVKVDGVGDGSSSGGLAIFKGRANWPAKMQVTSMEDPGVLAGLQAAVIKWPNGYAAGQYIYVLDDIDGDGKREIAAGNSFGDFLKIIPAQAYAGYQTMQQVEQANPNKIRTILHNTPNDPFGVDGCSGRNVASGDLDGDGVADLFMANVCDYANGGAGDVVAIKGGADLPTDFNLIAIPQGVKHLHFTGTVPGGSAGIHLAVANNMQGLPTLMIGADTDKGNYFCLPGTPFGSIWSGNHPLYANGSTVPLNAQALANLGGINIQGAAGDQIAGEGFAANSDTNADGFLDFFMGAAQGKGFHLNGATTETMGNGAQAGLASAAFTFNIPNTGFGAKVVGGGDVDGEGTAEVLVHAPYAALNGKTGVTYLMFGGQ